MNKVIVILGPTCVGKTKLSVELAKKFDNDESFTFINGILGAYVRQDENTAE